MCCGQIEFSAESNGFEKKLKVGKMKCTVTVIRQLQTSDNRFHAI